MLDYFLTEFYSRVQCLEQEPGNNLCGYYVCEFIRHETTERRGVDKFDLDKKRERLLPKHRVVAICEELAGFLLKEVIPRKGEYHDPY
jgi:hypothetical protein